MLADVAIKPVDLPRGASPRTGDGGRRRWRRRAWWAALVGVALLAFCVRVRLLLHSGGLDGLDGYDDGVYYAAADALVHRRMPYRDFLLLQPPGLVVALAPFAWLGSVLRDPVGVVAARLAFIGVGALNASLLMVAARRYGRSAAAVAGIGYAVYLPAAYSERSTLLEPLGTCGLLVAVLLIQRAPGSSRSTAVLAGVAAGLAIGMRIWYVVPVAVIAAVHWRSGARFVAGVAASGCAIYLPFFLSAPQVMFREIVLDQMGRSRDTVHTPFRRASTFLGATNLHLPEPWSAVFSFHKLGLLAVIVVIVCVAAAFTIRGARLYPLLALTGAAVLLASPSFFLHYAALPAPWVVLTVAVGGTRLVALVRVRSVRVALVAVGLAAIVSVNLRAVQDATPSSPIPTAVLRPAAQAVHGCVIADDPQILAALDVLSKDYALGCTVWPDVTGYTYDRDAEALPRAQNPVWQADVTHYLLSGSAVIVHRAGTALDSTSSARVRSRPVLAHSGTWTLYGTRR